MLFSLVVPVFQTPSILNIFLSSLSATLEYSSQIIFINDGSGREIEDILENYKTACLGKHQIVILNHKRCHGCVKSINAALEKVTGEFTVVLDSDIILTPQWQTKVCQSFYSMSDAGAICPLLLFPQNKGIQCAGMIFSECMARRKFFLRKYNPDDFTHPYEVQAGVFAFCAIRSDVIKKTGLLDADYFNGYEDIDYQLRIRKLGFKIYVNPKIIIYHWEKSNGIHRFYNKRNNTASLWKKHSAFIQNDLWRCIREQLDVYIDNSQLIPVDLCESRIDGQYFFQNIIPLYSLSYILDYSFCVSVEVPIWLPELLPIDSCRTPDRYMFFCDSFIELIENDYWYTRRKAVRDDDIIVDLQGNVLLFSELSNSFWPGRSIRF